MQRIMILALSASLLPLAGAAAQGPVEPGARVRISADKRYVGTYFALEGRSIVLDTETGHVLIPVDSVRKFEISSGRGIDWDSALKGAGSGTLIMAVPTILSLAGGDDAPAWVLPASLAYGAVVGGALRGGGTSAKTAGTILTVVGGVAGLLIGASNYEPVNCTPDDFLCMDFGPIEVVGGAVLGAGAGLLVGSVGGALLGGERWEEQPSDPLAIHILARPDGGAGLAATVKVR